jgi:WD40 repeat protein
LSVAFSPDGHILAVSGADGTIWLWNATNPGHLTQIGHPLTGPSGGVFSVAFSPDGRTLIAGSTDNTIRLWDITNPADPSQIGQPLTDSGNLYSVALSPDGHTLATGSDNTVWPWNLDVNQVADRICATTSNNLTSQQWARYVPQLPYDPPCRQP